MKNFRILLFSTGQLGGILDVGYTTEQSEIVIDLLDVFNAEVDIDSQKININYKQRNTISFRENLNFFISKYKKAVPSIQKLREKFNNLEKDEWFFILPPTELKTKQKYDLEKELNALNNRQSNVSEEQVRELFGCIIDNYEIITFDLDKNHKVKIGEGQKNKRVCRFCKQNIPDVSFKQEAHAISESLGNKRIILNEECDTCNSFFDENVERDFIYYHDLARTMFGIKNKGNEVPKIKGKNFCFYRNDGNNLSVVIHSCAENKTTNGLPEKVVFDTGNKIKKQNIYKALCKFALSVIDSRFVSDFDETIKWIKNEKDATALPKIAVLNSYGFYTERPELTLYLRNNDNKNLPYLVGEFRFTFYLYVFIVPFSDKDSKKFLSDTDYKIFLDCFKNIESKKEFSYLDFSQNSERKLCFNINFEREENNNTL